MSGIVETYGDWQEGEPAAGQQMELEAAQLAAHWRRCSLSADFWAGYAALQAPGQAPPGRLSRQQLKHVLGYLLNELFENCAKFSAGPIGAVRYASRLGDEGLTFSFTNHIVPEAQPAFVRFIGELLAGDPEALYFERLERSAESGEPGSGLGYLTLIKDYGVRFGFRFQPVTDSSVAVTVQAHVGLEEV